MRSRLAFSTLETPRVRIRRFTLEDVPAMVAYRNHVDVARYQSWQRWSEADARDLVQSVEGTDPGWPGWWFQVAVTLRDTDEVIGDVGLHTFRDEPHQGEIGYSLAPDYQGRGLMSEALTALLDLAYGKLKMHRISARVHHRNHPSCRLLERLGFRREAHFVQGWWFKGTWADELIYAQLASEWQARVASFSDAEGR